jgi:predicted ATP-grasp superfamily ATP-dependent carboligase
VVTASSKQTLVIAAIASRPYVKAAVDAGYEVIAIDCFADVDTRQLAKCVYVVHQHNGQLNSGELLEIMANIDLDRMVGFCYGAGLEKAPDVLNEISRYVSVLGNAPDVIKQCKIPGHFFKLCSHLAVPYPEVADRKPLETKGWLQKEIGNSGGAHIAFVDDRNPAEKGVYYQKFQEGQSVSCLFLAVEQGVNVVGFSEQWLSADKNVPFRYKGAASHADISVSAKANFTSYVKKLSQALSLVGLNSCDAICLDDDVVVLEINPRLSASMDLYTFKQDNLMAMHIAASKKSSSVDSVKTKHLVCQSSQAHQVVYAKCDTLVSSTHGWPLWLSDVPEIGSCFKSGMPICTVLAEAETSALAKNRVQARALAFESEFLT